MSVKQVPLELLATTLSNAANHIHVHGWWRTGLGDDSVTEAACISNAISYVSTEIDVSQAAQSTLLAHFGLNELEELFNLNDAQPFNIGKEWAIEHLRAVAAELRNNNARYGAAV